MHRKLQKELAEGMRSPTITGLAVSVSWETKFDKISKSAHTSDRDENSEDRADRSETSQRINQQDQFRRS